MLCLPVPVYSTAVAIVTLPPQCVGGPESQVTCAHFLLQLEALDEVERAFVHVDYRKREEPEHKIERNLLHNPKDLMSPHEAVAESSGSAAFAADQAMMAKQLNDHLQASKSVSNQAKRAASEASHLDIRSVDQSSDRDSHVDGDNNV